MHPMIIVQRALQKRLDLIAICDHNASANASFVFKAANGTSLKVIAGMEITSMEEVHLLALFESLSNLNKLQNLIDRHLHGENDENKFGLQAIVNETGEVEGIESRLLIGATDLSVDSLVQHIHQLGGLAIPAHIDRESFSIISQLGFIDDRSCFDALEVSKLMDIPRARALYAHLKHYPFITSSDAHFVDDIGASTTSILMQEANFSELKMALSHAQGRHILENPC